MKESEIKVTIVDETLGLGANPADTGVNVLCPIRSKYGPTRLTYVSGPTQFRRLFNNGAPITSEDDITMKYARALTNHTPIYVKRAAGGSIKSGVTSGTTHSTVYVDEYDNMISGAKLKFRSSVNYAYWSSKISEFLGTSDYVLDSNIYYLYRNDSGVEKTDDIIRSSASATSNTTIKLNTSNLGGSVTIGHQVVYLGGTDLYTAVSNIISVRMPLGISTNSSGTVHVTNGEFEAGNSNITDINLYYQANDISSKDQSGEDTGIVVTEGTNIDIYILKSEEEYRNESIINLNGFSYKQYDSDQETSVSFSTNAPSVAFKDLSKYYRDYFLSVGLNVGESTDNSIVVEGLAEFSVTAVDNPKYDVEYRAIATPDMDRFAVISKFPNASDVIKLEIKSYDKARDVASIEVKYGDIDEEWEFGFKSDAVDSYGASIYYQNINQNSEIISILPINDTNAAVSTGTINFGSGISTDYVSDADVAASLIDIIDNEEAPALFDYIVDGGIVSESVSAAILRLCEKYYSFYPASCPTDSKLNAKSIVTYREFIGDTAKANYVAAAQMSSAIDKGVVILPGGYWYLVHRLNLAPTVEEYSALFGKNKGRIGISSPTRVFKVSEREKLGDHQIITLAHAIDIDDWYLNNNLTCYKSDSFLKEDGISLMVNKISQIADSYAQTLIGEWNTVDLRNRVATTLTNSLKTRLRVGTNYGPIDLTVVCNSTNNPDYLINRGDLAIDIYASFTRSIHNVLIYSHIQPLQSE